ncbi:homeobox protein ceh-32 [Zootermopsis nevadensis]|uniref:Homeobox protein Mohawk n=1 Tax=Zootermopsis nevadensis TaxID=136037 RepID=A0A067QPB8_ZOONE|nr:homeobox protein ceh-32 [Zootermopsis nevadensis]XP_021934534.1 homeobox protein ceh-32 [Zootermopsis nevadensis]XP_021934535.1 homeobox protein ceh-32 [Zootermopsis nevadensis]KDR11464.1 Homeobox protein Mohawk [Zootermopsis nevadensis]
MSNDKRKQSVLICFNALFVNMVTENSNSCQNHRHHHKHHRHHHKHHRRHSSCKDNVDTKRLKKLINNDTAGARNGEEGRSREVSEEKSGTTKQERKHLAGRVLRNRRYKRPFEDNRHTKRLFTPEIKRFLKSWLVRRRDNPYPSRDEKKDLAVQTGLTYIQICNWFANWRRKLKNAGCEAPHHTWGNLIKSYNTKAQGNVEQFSLCSDDSIWEEQEISDREHDETNGVGETVAPLSYVINATAMDHSYSTLYHQQNSHTSSAALLMENMNSETRSQNHHNEQCVNFTVSTKRLRSEMTGTVKPEHAVPLDQSSGSTNKYKNVIMEKYLTDLRVCQELSSEPTIMKRETMSSRQTKKHCRDSESDNVEFGQHNTDGNIYTDTSCNRVIESGIINNGCGNITRKCKCQKKDESHPLELSKWLESAAKFKPGQNYVTWSGKNTTWQSSSCEIKEAPQWNVTATDGGNYWSIGQHHREELDAAEALTHLSNLHQ